MSITATHADYDKHIKTWNKLDDACDGQEVIKEKREVYLPLPTLFKSPKDLEGNLLESLTTLTILTFKPPNDIKNLEKVIDRFMELEHQNFRNLAFLTECLDDNEINEHVKRYNKISGKIAIRFDLFSDPICHESFATNPIPESLCREYGEVCEKLIDDLKLYSTYRKSFKYK